MFVRTSRHTPRTRPPKIVPVDQPQPDEQDMHARLEDLGRMVPDVVRARSIFRCDSAEGSYRPEGLNVLQGIAPRKQVDEQAMLAIDAALVKLPLDHRKALQWRYYDQRSDVAICKALELASASYQRFMRDARLTLGAAFRGLTT